jgi:hypothetical protein
MSDMEIFYGTFSKSDKKIEPEDTDDFYDMEKRDHCHYVKVDGQLYSFQAIENVEPHGFILHIPASEEDRIMCYWYNGGAGIHEVMEDAIRNIRT